MHSEYVQWRKSRVSIQEILRTDIIHNHFQLVNRVSNLTILPSNIAIPTSLIDENENGQLQIVFYVQTEEGFLFGYQLEMAVQVTILLLCFQLVYFLWS